jgi:hypothetical protein
MHYPRCTNYVLSLFDIVIADRPINDGLAVIEQLQNKYKIRFTEHETTINKFIANHPTGKFYIGVSNHALAVIDGTIYDYSGEFKNYRIKCVMQVID